MYRHLNSEQRQRLIIRQSTPEWKAAHEERMNLGIKAGTHAVCEVCGHAGKNAEAEFDICTSCWNTPWRSEQKACVILATNARRSDDA